MTTSRADLPVTVDRTASTPLASQVAGQVRDAVTSGVLGAGDRLPSSRDLAATLGVSRTVVTGAYLQLFAEGWLEGRHGSGTYVADVAPLPAAPAPAGPRKGAVVPPPGRPIAAGGAEADGEGRYVRNEEMPGAGGDLIELAPGIPWVAGIDQAAWRRAWRAAGRRPPSDWPDEYGVGELRGQLAGYLRRSRGLAVTPEQVMVTRGVTSGLTMLAAALVRPGDLVGVEDPGYPRAREVLERAGARVVPCRVDAHGIVPEDLPAGLRLLYTTPAHQYPLGGRLPVGRRQALAAWARRHGTVVVEDDYDSEFRYDVGPLPALRSIDPDVIVYLGTASKTLTPAVGVGWLVAHPELLERLAATRVGLGERVSEPAQHALASLLATGDLERHVRRMRLEYARRRAALVEGLGTGPFRLLGDTAGMHVVVELADGGEADRACAEAHRQGVAITTLDRYFAGPVTCHGLILGYGATALTRVRQAAKILSGVLSRP